MFFSQLSSVEVHNYIFYAADPALKPLSSAYSAFSLPLQALQRDHSVQGFPHWERCCITCHVSGMYHAIIAMFTKFIALVKQKLIGEKEKPQHCASFSLLPLFDHFLRLWLI
jgi:hypothetical protein